MELPETFSGVRITDFTAVMPVEKSVSCYNEERISKVSKTNYSSEVYEARCLKLSYYSNMQYERYSK